MRAAWVESRLVRELRQRPSIDELHRQVGLAAWSPTPSVPDSKICADADVLQSAEQFRLELETAGEITAACEPAQHLHGHSAVRLPLLGEIDDPPCRRRRVP